MNAEDSAPRLQASYFDGRTSKRHAAIVEAYGGHLSVRAANGEFAERCEAWRDVQIAEAVGTAPRRIGLADGAYCEVADGQAFAQWMRVAHLKPALIERLQQRWRWVLLSLCGAVAVVAVTYVWGLPLVAQAIVPHIPPAMTNALSENALAAMDNGLLSPSTLPEARRERIRAKVAKLVDATGPNRLHRLEFRAFAKTPNAFALPNGDVVIFDGLVQLAANDDEVAAVVAHELGHVVHRHGLRHLIQASVVSAAVGFYFGDISSIATGLASLALESRYSREFEVEADRYAAERLRAHGMSPTLLANILERMDQQAHGGPGVDALSSHPETAQRVMTLRQLSDL